MHSDWPARRSRPTPNRPPAELRPRRPAVQAGQPAAVDVGDEEVVDEAPAADGAVVDVVVVGPAAAAAATAAADGVNVAVNGVRSGLGSTTGMVSTAKVRVGVPNCTVVAPEAWMFWTVPADSSPAHTVVPVAAEATWTQHDPVPVAVIWNEALGIE